MEDEYGHGQLHRGGGGRQTDAYGNPIGSGDLYEKPVHHTTTMGDYSTTGTIGAYRTDDVPPTAGFGGPNVTGTGIHEQSHLCRSSSSSSSSSSEDDGMGRRRKKKGIKEKIMEKLPGHKHDSTTADTTTTPAAGAGYGYGGEAQHREKKGMIEKIKEKLPGHH